MARRVRRALGRLARRPWSRIYPTFVTDRALLSATGTTSIDELWQTLAATPFFVNASRRPTWTAAIRTIGEDAPASIIAAADRILMHEFDLLGSGPTQFGPRLPWHEDFKTRRVWPLRYSENFEVSEFDKPSDVKVPWELSRCQHFTRLGQAYWLTNDERYAREFVAEVSDWIDENPWGRGVNWVSTMDVALRAISWIWGFHFFAESRACEEPGFRSRLLRSLYLHGEHIATHLEQAPVNGNHYVSDGAGLVFLGCFFRSTRKGHAWRDNGRAIVIGEMQAQVSEDGVDFEASTAYHGLVLELFLTAYQLLGLNGETIPAAEWQRLERMCEFVEAYTKPNGRVPLVGDADDGCVQILGSHVIGDHRHLLSTGAVLFGRVDFKRAAGRLWHESFWLLGPEAVDLFARLPEPIDPRRSKAFPAGGFFVLRDGDTHLFIDCGNVGMRGTGGHGHNDILSFELVLDGMPIVTDSGAYLYTASREWRNRFRSTAFHGTIQVDGEEVNRFVGPDALWQLRNDATPYGVSFTHEARVDRFLGAHDGYRRLPDPVRVTREAVLMRGESVVAFADTIEGTAQHVVVWRFPLEPGLQVAFNGGDVRFERDGAVRWLLPITGAESLRWTLEPGWVSPSYGVKHESLVLTASGEVQLPYRLTYLFAARRESDAERRAAARDVGLDRTDIHATDPA
jgi:uncharacterized heparinase superfamily protein